tara:strand:- start:113 stop:1888 length:1776 start_codon:yes stop_codon:yes gene_type:complete
MVSFKWGVSPTVLPERADFFVTEMKNYIQTGDKSFIVKYNKALEQVNPENAKKIEEEFKAVLKKVMDLPLTPILKTDGEGWKRFSTQRMGKTTETNQENVSYMQDKTIKDILDFDVVNRLRGSAIAGFFKDGSLNLPEFDFFEELKLDALNVKEHVSLKEQQGERGEGRYNIKAGEGYDSHFSCAFPTNDGDKVANKKKDVLTQMLGTDAPYRNDDVETNIKVEPIKYGFDVTEKTINDMNEIATSETRLTRVEEVKGEYETTGEQLPLDAYEAIEIAFAEEDFDNRNQKMIDEKIIILDGEMYQYQKKDTTGRRDKVILEFGAKNPLTFIKENKDTFERILQPILGDISTVKTVEVKALIRTKKGVSSTFSQDALSRRKKLEAGNEDINTYSMLKYKNNETGEIISVEGYAELEEEEQVNYTHFYDELSPAEIVTISSKAYRTKEKDANGEYGYIAEDAFNALRRAVASFDVESIEEDLKEKAKRILSEKKELLDSYEPSLQVMEGAENLKPNIKTTESYGKDTYKTNEVNSENIKEKFKEAYVEVDLVITKHGFYNLNPFAKTSANRPMSKHANKIKKHVRKLKRNIGE